MENFTTIQKLLRESKSLRQQKILEGVFWNQIPKKIIRRRVQKCANKKYMAGFEFQLRFIFYCQNKFCYNTADMKYIRESLGKKMHRVPLAERSLLNNQQLDQQADISIPYKDKIKQMEIEESCFQKREQQIYEEQIIHFLATQQNQHLLDCNYFYKQSDITEHMRAVLLNWLIDVHIKYRLQPQTLFITVFLIDLYLNQKQINRSNLQLVGITALWIAAKYQQTYQVPKLSNLVFICDSTYSKDDIRWMEGEIISVTGFDILRSTSLHYFNTVNRVIGLSEKDYFLGRYMLEICLFDINMQKYSSKVLASSIVFFINKLRRRQICWGENLSQIFFLGEEQLKPCAREVCNLWQKASVCEHMSSLKNKFMSIKYKQVAKIRLGITSKPSISQ